MGTHDSDWRYDVFLSFCGEDTRHTFTGHLYNALQLKGINTFMDDDGLKGGFQISLSLVKAIEESRISLVVFSENYASSSWCLDELVKIIECMKMKNQLVWPIFYKVEPSDIRHQRNRYGEAMAEHQKRLRNESEKVQKWRSALSEAANLKGWHFQTG
ncbi:TMV resistance protein N-like [Abrus precatorius]|uniref:TMV resistance protein N-like n=1 Tax=Abrus precatorius TaxID=3816 RepID=A0A8B8MKZ9_ABRPR|nr:TMV resistance protein N-like [Abrus precatorius]